MATSARNWKKNNNHELELPSGNTALVKRPGLEKLLTAGVLPDTLTPIAMDAVAKAQGKQPEDHKKKKGQESNEFDAELMQQFMKQEGALEDIFAAFDKVTAMCVIEPKVVLHMRQVLDEGGNPKKDVKGRDVWEDIPQEERLSDEVPEQIDGKPNPFYSADPPLYTDDVDHKDKEFIFEFVSGGSPELARFRDSGDDVATS